MSRMTPFSSPLLLGFDSVEKTLERIAKGGDGYPWGPTGVAPGEVPFEVINHSREAALASQYLADFFVNECRKSGHHYATAADEQAALMYNDVYNVSQYEAPEFVQTYFLHWPDSVLRKTKRGGA